MMALEAAAGLVRPLEAATVEVAEPLSSLAVAVRWWSSWTVRL